MIVFSCVAGPSWRKACGCHHCCRAVKTRMTGSISCCRKRTYDLPLQPGVLSQKRSVNRSLVESGEGCGPSICGEVKLRWRVLADRMYTKAPTGKSKQELDALLVDRAVRRNHTNPYEEKPYCGAAIKEVQAWWKQCKEWMAHFKGQNAPLVFDFKSLLKALSGRKQKLSRKWMHLRSIVQKVADSRGHLSTHFFLPVPCKGKQPATFTVGRPIGCVNHNAAASIIQ